MIDNGFVFAANKQSEKLRKQALKDAKKREKTLDILKKYDTTLDAVRAGQLTKSEYDYLVSYIREVLKYPLTYYPNLAKWVKPVPVTPYLTKDEVTIYVDKKTLEYFEKRRDIQIHSYTSDAEKLVIEYGTGKPFYHSPGSVTLYNLGIDGTLRRPSTF